MAVELVPMTAEHRRAVIDIFNHYVEHTFAAYPEKPVAYEFFDMMVKACAGYPAVVACDEGRQVVGFGMLRPYHPMAAFAQTAEISYFLKAGLTGHGIGRRILDHLVEEACRKGLTTILASISSRNEGSIRFHARNGFVECGRFRCVGRKNGEAFDVVWMQRMI